MVMEANLEPCALRVEGEESLQRPLEAEKGKGRILL